MKTIRQLLRQPVKTMAGILLVAAAVAVLSVCAGQSLAARNTMETLDHQFTTAALPTNAYNQFDGSYTIPEEISDWIAQTIAEHPELVVTDFRPGLASAYIPRLNSDLYVCHDYRPDALFSISGTDAHSVIPSPEGAPYTCAMLEITVTGIEPLTELAYDEETETFTEVSAGAAVRGVIDRVHTLHEGYPDPIGMLAKLSYDLTPEELEAMGIEPGARCLVYGKNYYDWDWQLRGSLKLQYDGEVDIDRFDLEKITYYTEEQMKSTSGRYAAEYQYGYKTIRLSKFEAGHLRTVELREPELVRLEGSAGEFLASEEGAQWREYLDIAQVNDHAFPLIGVDRLGYIAAFAQQNARIVKGRDFTQEELDGGAKVCIMAQSLAAANGLSVGDTLSVRYYDFDPEMEGQYLLSDGWGTTEPTAYFYGESTPFAGEAEEYTIIGLYRCNNEWHDPLDDPYAFTPNTIFVPKTSVTGTMDYSDQAFFRTIVLKNGSIPEFRQLVDEAGYEGLFVYYDQGYSEVSESFHDYQTAARRTMLVGVGLYCVLLALFLLLFPARQGASLYTMDSLGAGRRHKLSHIVVSALGILVPGTVIGTAVGLLLRGRVSDALAASAQVAVAVETDMGGMLLLSAAQLTAAIGIVLLLAVLMTRPGNLMKKK